MEIISDIETIVGKVSDSKQINEIVKNVIRREKHHVRNATVRESDGEVVDLNWSYDYVRGHARGGAEKGHHVCRQCGDIVLGRITIVGNKICPRCAYVPQPKWFNKPSTRN